MKEGYSHLTLVLDESGSMDSFRDATIEGLNSFVSKQKEVKGTNLSTTVSLYKFNSQINLVHNFVNLNDFPKFNRDNYNPENMTALLDAIGRAIDETGKTLDKMAESKRPSRVIMVIQTDGQENDSHIYVPEEYTQRLPRSFWTSNRIIPPKNDVVNKMIKHQQDKYNWEFIFLGANQDAIATASGLGIGSKSALTYTMNNTSEVFDKAADYTTSYRCANTIAAAKMCSFSEQDRQDVVKTTNSTSTK